MVMRHTWCRFGWVDCWGSHHSPVSCVSSSTPLLAASTQHLLALPYTSRVIIKSAVHLFDNVSAVGEPDGCTAACCDESYHS